MTNKPKKQHTVPCFLLTRFTREQSETALLWVTELQERRQWPSSPRKTARRTDFYTGDFGPGIDVYSVEKSLGACESRWASVVKKITSRSSIPDEGSDDFAEMMGFIAFQALRGSSSRTYIAKLFDEYSQQQAIKRLSDEGRWDRFVCSMESLGEAVEVSRKEMLEDLKQGAYQINVDKTWTIQQQIRAAITLMPYLSLREWSLFVPEDDAPDFVCSDSPVCVTTATGVTDRSVGFCQPKSVVTVPIGRRHALAGFFEGSINTALPVNEVAGFNTMTMQHAQQVYCADEEFKYLCKDGKVGVVGDLLNVHHT